MNWWRQWLLYKSSTWLLHKKGAIVPWCGTDKKIIQPIIIHIAGSKPRTFVWAGVRQNWLRFKINIIILLVQVIVELMLRFLVLLFPCFNVLLQSESLLTDTFAEIALVVEMLLFHWLSVLAEILVFDRLLVLLGVDVHLATSGCEILSIQSEGGFILGDLSGFSDMVPALSNLSEHHLLYVLNLIIWWINVYQLIMPMINDKWLKVLMIAIYILDAFIRW